MNQRLFQQLLNNVTHGDCLDVMSRMPSASIDMVLTDPPYGVRYRDRSGRQIRNDDTLDWLPAAFAGCHRVLRPNTVCISFYSWTRADVWLNAARSSGFRVAGHLVFPKPYASNTGLVAYRHEQAFVFAKGRPLRPLTPLPDVVTGWADTGNRLHPTQKPIGVLQPLIRAFTSAGAVVLDPFCGSGSTLVAAHSLGRHYVGIELEAIHCRTARSRLRDFRAA